MARAQHSSSARTRTPAKKSAPAAAPPTIWTRHGRDIIILALGVVGIFVALADFTALGPLGHWLDVALEATCGLARWVVPVAMLGLGAALLSGKLEVDRWRLGLGLSLGLVSISGLAHFVGSQPGYRASVSRLGGAGGWLGVAIGGGLNHVIGIAGTLVILAALFVIAIVFVTGITLTGLIRLVARFVRALARTVASWWRVLPRPTLSTEDSTEVSGDGGDQVDVVDLEEPRKPRRRRSEPADADEADLAIAAGLVIDDAEPDHDVADPFVSVQEPDLPPAARPRDDVVVRHPSAWTLPSIDLLQRVKELRPDKSAIQESGDELIAALAAHGVETTLVGYTVGPTVTRFEIELGPGVKVSSVTSLHRDIAYAMASPDVRILAPIPGRSAIGVEVPNKQRVLVALGDLLAADEALAAHHPLDVPIGRDISGKAVVINLAEMPHVLISGATGAGKSSCINSLITSLVMRATPDELRLILVDPKRVELGQYNDLPHLLSPVVVDPKKAAATLSWAVKEMERRYDILAEYRVRDIAGYRTLIASGTLTSEPTVAEQVADVLEGATGRDFPVPESKAPEDLPYIVIVVDELNDLMMVAARDVEDSVVRIAQMARAVGIHLVLATQRPSVDVITGVIKANIPSRMAFAVSSLADSRVILDQAGAERLIGKGDVLLLSASSNVARRLQSPWVSEDEVRKVVAAWRAQGNTPETVVALEGSQGPGAGMFAGDHEDDDAVLARARELVIRTQSGSTSMLQRKLRVGFARAGRLMDLLEAEGVVAAGEGSKARRVLVGPEVYETGEFS